MLMDRHDRHPHLRSSHLIQPDLIRIGRAIVEDNVAEATAHFVLGDHDERIAVALG